jgi:hypothetical protein
LRAPAPQSSDGSSGPVSAAVPARVMKVRRFMGSFARGLFHIRQRLYRARFLHLRAPGKRSFVKRNHTTRQRRGLSLREFNAVSGLEMTAGFGKAGKARHHLRWASRLPARQVCPHCAGGEPASQLLPAGRQKTPSSAA